MTASTCCLHLPESYRNPTCAAYIQTRRTRGTNNARVAGSLRFIPDVDMEASCRDDPDSATAAAVYPHALLELSTFR